MRLERLHEILARASGKRITVAGDLMLDEFVWGKVGRISPEAPVPVVEVTGESFYPGGAANVARNRAGNVRLNRTALGPGTGTLELELPIDPDGEGILAWGATAINLRGAVPVGKISIVAGLKERTGYSAHHCRNSGLTSVSSATIVAKRRSSGRWATAARN